METQKKQSLDDFFNEQETVKLYATIEVDKSNPLKVLIKPWVSGGGCSCHQALKIDRNAIESVTPTGQTHYCCGKELKVVQIQFKPEQTLTMEDVFKQLSSSKHSHSTADHHSEPQLDARMMSMQPERNIGYSPRQIFANSLQGQQKLRCLDTYDNCLSRCQYSYDPEQCECMCRNGLSICTGIGRLFMC